MSSQPRAAKKPKARTVAKKKVAAKAPPTAKLPPVEEEPVEQTDADDISQAEQLDQAEQVESADQSEQSNPEDNEGEGKSLEQRLKDGIEELKDYKAVTRGFCNHQIELLEEALKENRKLRKFQKKPREKKDPKKPSVFEIPVPISDQLADFLDKPHGTTMSRNEVTHELHAYCDKHKLMDDGNRRNINPNAKFKKLLKGFPASGTQLTWLNIQSYIKHHYK